MQTEKILLDTDIGSDIDDAVCLAYLLANPACELLGITTVSGQADLRAQLASALCRVAGREVPIYPGVEVPLLVGQRQKTAPQAAALSRWPHQEAFPQGQALEFLRRTIHAHPDEVTLLTIGPLTNIGLLLASDPEISRLLKRLVMMCGVFTNHTAGAPRLEWNALIDPHATAIVYRSPIAVHRSIGLDVTLQVVMAAAEVRRRFQHPRLLPVLDFAEIWFQEQEKITFHDPLAAVTLFDDAVCAFQRGRVEVELADQETIGMTRWTPDPGGPHEAALQVDPGAFFKHFFSFFNQEY
jgi:inosine-uridine nucleoside N-ribohydrolase